MAIRGDDTENGGMVAVAARNKPSVPAEKSETLEVQALRKQVHKLNHELVQERAARREAEERADRLEKRVEELEEKLDNVLRGFRASEQMLQKEITKLQVEIRDLKEKLSDAEKTLAWFRKDKFGPRDEELTEQELAELRDNEPGARRANEPDWTEMQEPYAAKAGEPGCRKCNEPGAKDSNEPRNTKPRGQQPGSSGHGRSDWSAVPLADTISLEIPGGCKCATCGKSFKILKKTDDLTLADIQFLVQLIKYRSFRYAPQCRCPGNKIETAKPPDRLYPGTNLTNESWLYLCIQKFLLGIPTNRTIKELALARLPLAHGTIVGGFHKINPLLDSLYDGIIAHCQGADLWVGDETSWRVFDAEKIQWWLWVIASKDAVVYILDPSRSKNVPENFFSGSEGVLMTDRLSAYKRLSSMIKKAWCWVHQRRDFRKIFDGMPKLKSWALDWLLTITELFVRNQRRVRLWLDGQAQGPRWDAAVKAVEEQIETIRLKCDADLKQPHLHKAQRKALSSLIRHWEGLTIFLTDPRIPLDNNRAERLLRGAVILRKNSYGSGTASMGDMTAKMLSVIHTWLANRLNPQDLLLDYFNECAKNGGKPPPNVAEFLPWTMSEERKQQFALPHSYKVPA